MRTVVGVFLGYCASGAAAAPSDGIPNFSPAAGVAWQSDTREGLAPIPTGPQPVGVDPVVFKDVPYDMDTAFPVLDVANPNLQPWVADALKAQNEQTIDHVSQDELIYAGYSQAARDQAQTKIENFKRYIEEHKDELLALQVFYGQATPDRLRFLTAKSIAFAAAGTVLSLLTAVAVAATGTVVLTLRDLPLPDLGELLAQVGRNAALAALLGAFGVGIGALIRNQIAAVVALLVMAMVVEPTVLALAPEVGRYGPLGALSAGAAGLPNDAVGIPDEVGLFGVVPSILLLLAWIGVAFTTAAGLFVRRDLE